jgi:hypothetical protein
VRRCNVILLLGLLLWIEPASAQDVTVHPLKVSIHQAIYAPSIQSAVESILEKASLLLQTQDDDQDVSCNVGFKLDGPITTFGSAPADITDAISLEAVHHVPADVKIVRSITYCVGELEKEGFWGCSWRPKGLRKTMIVTMPGTGVEPVLWAHEFGHTTGLRHRKDPEDLALMLPNLEPFHQHVTKNECRHLIAGRVKK